MMVSLITSEDLVHTHINIPDTCTPCRVFILLRWRDNDGALLGSWLAWCVTIFIILFHRRGSATHSATSATISTTIFWSMCICDYTDICEGTKSGINGM